MLPCEMHFLLVDVSRHIIMTDLDPVRAKLIAETVKKDLPGIENVESVVAGCEKEAQNFMALVYRVLVRFNTSNESQWLFVKVRPKAEDQLTEWASFDIAFKNECQAYQNLKELDFPMAKCYLATPDMIILEDLVSKGFKMMDKLKGLDLVQTKLVLEKLAKFHQSSILLRKEKASSFVTLSSKFQDLYMNFNIFPDNSDYLDKIVGFLEDEDEDVKTIIKEYANGVVYSLVKQFIKLNKGNKDHVLLGINHGDCWINNMMLREEQTSETDSGTNTTVEMKFVDLQSIDVNSVLVDLVTFLVTSVEFQVLIEHYPNLIEHYWTHLNISQILLKEQFHKELQEYKQYYLPVFLFRGLPMRSVSQEELKRDIRLFVQFLRKHDFL
uniref:CHK kinase-like domain-containing protein n=1 Tax=Cacopsylla melanoneura TaxID=428564 RepID=A0A8D9AKX3_9HEMI